MGCSASNVSPKDTSRPTSSREDNIKYPPAEAFLVTFDTDAKDSSSVIAVTKPLSEATQLSEIQPPKRLQNRQPAPELKIEDVEWKLNQAEERRNALLEQKVKIAKGD